MSCQVIWDLATSWVRNIPVKGEEYKTTCPAPSWLDSSGIAEVVGSNSIHYTTALMCTRTFRGNYTNQGYAFDLWQNCVSRTIFPFLFGLPPPPQVCITFQTCKLLLSLSGFARMTQKTRGPRCLTPTWWMVNFKTMRL